MRHSLVMIPFLLGILAGTNVSPAQTATAGDPLHRRLSALEKEFEELRTVLHIPGISAAVVKDQQLIWSKGFGHADREKSIPVTPDTPFRIASLTKTFASTLLMQLVEQGKLNLDDSMSKFSPDFKDDAVKVRHVFSHTSEGTTPGTRYSYNGNRFASLDAVIEKCAGKPFRELLAETILDKLGMTHSVPGQDSLSQTHFKGKLSGEKVKQYESALQRIAVPYTLYGKDELIRTGYPPRSISTSAGLVSTVTDLAKYDAALDRHVFLKKETQELAWTPMKSNDGRTLPYGLGWFVQDYQKHKLVWHYGLWPVFSALILKVPERNITLLLLANNDGVSSPFGLGNGNVTNSPFATAFLRRFVFEDVHGCELPGPAWGAAGDPFREEVAKLEKDAKGYSYRMEGIAHGRMRAYLNNRVNRVKTEVQVKSQVLDIYAGRYARPGDITVIIARDGKHLSWQATVQHQGRPFVFDPEMLFAESETKFFDKTNYATQITFVKDDSGKVIEIVMRQNGRDNKVPRVRD